MSIEVEKHHTPKTLMDKFVYYTVQTLKIPVGLFFQVCTMGLIKI